MPPLEIPDHTVGLLHSASGSRQLPRQLLLVATLEDRLDFALDVPQLEFERVMLLLGFILFCSPFFDRIYCMFYRLRDLMAFCIPRLLSHFSVYISRYLLDVAFTSLNDS